MPTALITGITGQDGHHLTKFLLSKGYKVAGLINGQHNSREGSFSHLFPEVTASQARIAATRSLSRPAQRRSTSAPRMSGSSLDTVFLHVLPAMEPSSEIRLSLLLVGAIQRVKRLLS